MNANTQGKHTPGPWSIKPTSKGTVVREERNMHGEASSYKVYIRRDTGESFEIVCDLDFGYGHKSDEANAHLIAAAPALLDACRLAYEPLRRKAETCRNQDWKASDQKLFNALQNAIWQAEGK